MPLLENYDLANASPGLLGGANAALNPYQPTLRDRIAAWMMGNQPATPERQNFVSGLMGSTGLGSTGASVVDFTPPGAVLGLQEAAQHKDPVGGILNAAALVPGAAVAKGAGLLEKAAPDVMDAAKGIIAYHGSPHSFDAFDLSKIGTGEGAQAYGHGLYFAESEPVAQSYKYSVSGRNAEHAFDGVPIKSQQDYWAIEDKLNAEGNWRQAKALKQYTQSFEPDIGLRLRQMKDWNRNDPEMLKAIDDLAGRISSDVPKGNMYQVRINADPAHFLDWDKPLSEQPANIRSLLNDPGIPQRPNDPAVSSIVRRAMRQDPEAANVGLMVDNDSTLYKEALSHAQRRDPVSYGKIQDGDMSPGDYIAQQARDFINASSYRNRPLGDFYKEMERTHGPQAAQDTFRQAGIPGIKYLDAGSRTAGDGSRNYVVFDDKLIDILKKYGLPIPVAGAGLDELYGAQPTGQQ